MCRTPSRVARQQSPPLVPHACQSTERLWADRAASVRWPRKRGRAEIPLAMNSTAFVFPSFTALPPLGQNCFCLRGLYGWSKNRNLRTRARACATLLTRFYGKAGILIFGALAHSGEAQEATLGHRLLSEGTRAGGGHLPHVRVTPLSLGVAPGRACSARVRL